MKNPLFTLNKENKLNIKSNDTQEKKSSSRETLIERVGYKAKNDTGNVKPKTIELKKTKKSFISEQSLKQNLIVSNLSHSPVSDIFNMLRTKVLSKAKANNWRVIAITSPRENAGKSFTAVNLAISIALKEENSVLLADFDFRRPSIQKYFDITSDVGLADYFNSNLSLSDVLIRPDTNGLESLPERLVLLPAGKKIKRSAELLSSTKMTNLVNELKNRYSDRIIIIDLPPLLDTADAMTFLNTADASLFVVAKGESTVDDIKSSMQLIDKKRLIGAIFNKSTENLTTSYY